MITLIENSEMGDMVNITISIHPSKINELGQLVDKLSAFAGNISRAGVKKAPAKAKSLTRDERRERNKNRLRGIK